MPFPLLPSQMSILDGRNPERRHAEFRQLAYSICSAAACSLTNQEGMADWALSSAELFEAGKTLDIHGPDELHPEASEAEITQYKEAKAIADAKFAAQPGLVEDLLKVAGIMVRAALSHPVYGTGKLTSTEIIDWCLKHLRDFKEGDADALEEACGKFETSLSFEANLARWKIAHSQLAEQQAELSPKKKLSLLKNAVKGTHLAQHLDQFIYQNPVLSNQSFEKLAKFLQKMDHAMPLPSPATTASHLAAAAVTTTTAAAAASTEAFKKLETTVAALEAKLQAHGPRPGTGDRRSTPKNWSKPCFKCTDANVLDPTKPVPKFLNCFTHNKQAIK